jgi:hypothetical protein
VSYDMDLYMKCTFILVLEALNQLLKLTVGLLGTFAYTRTIFLFIYNVSKGVFT